MTANHAQGRGSAVRALNLELQRLKDEPLEGFRIQLVNEDNLFEWEVAIFGPPETIYQGGYFKARMRFPEDYPYNPPTLKFERNTLYHPNVYESGDVCISILHPPVDDPQSGEHANERWNPTQNVRTILLSVISLLNEPNTSSPANVDASIMYRNWKDGKSKEYENIIQRQVTQSRLEAEKDGVKVPLTLNDYIVKQGPSSTKSAGEMDFLDDYDDMDADDDHDQSPSESQGPEEVPPEGDDDTNERSEEEQNQDSQRDQQQNSGDEKYRATGPLYSYRFHLSL